MKVKDKYKNSRRFAVALYVSVIGLCIYAVEEMEGAAAPILTTTLPTILLHAMAYSHTTNKEEEKSHDSV